MFVIVLLFGWLGQHSFSLLGGPAAQLGAPGYNGLGKGFYRWKNVEIAADEIHWLARATSSFMGSDC